MERLSGLDTSFLHLETPRVPMHVGMAAVFDPAQMSGGYSFQKVADHIADRVARHREFRRRLVRVPFDLHHPVWVDDPAFDVIHHVRQVALPKPGDLREFGAMVGRISSTPLDRSRALWEAWVVEGLEDGRFGLILKLHHAAVDGVSGARFLMHFLEMSPIPASLPPPPPRAVEELPKDMHLVADALRARLKQPLQAARVFGRTLMNYGSVVQTQARTEQPSGGRPLRAPRTPFNASVSARRNLAVARLPLSEIKQVKNALGATVNDVVLAITGGALRRYLSRKNALPAEPLTAVCPISVRTESEMAEMNNKVSAMWCTLGTDLPDPIARIGTIGEVTAAAKREHQIMGADMLQEWAETAPPTLLRLAVRFYCDAHLANRHRPIHNLVLSNVPGPRVPLYLGGARLEAAYPMGPVMEGAGLNLTVISYLDSMDFGFFVDSELVPDVWDLATDTNASFAEIRAAALGSPRGESGEYASSPCYQHELDEDWPKTLGEAGRP
jgi:WS/DGAT/MGAT family acyltransferase